MAQTVRDVMTGNLVTLPRPAGKEDVVRHAESRGASDDVLRVLRGLPLGR